MEIYQITGQELMQAETSNPVSDLSSETQNYGHKNIDIISNSTSIEYSMLHSQNSHEILHISAQHDIKPAP